MPRKEGLSGGDRVAHLGRLLNVPALRNGSSSLELGDEGENRKLFAQYIRVWYEKGTIPHIQFNVVDSRTLRDAQEHPDKYTNLQIRVAGYSAFWIDLSKETQDSIIARTEQSLC